jgi:hypothetical protein
MADVCPKELRANIWRDLKQAVLSHAEYLDDYLEDYLEERAWDDLNRKLNEFLSLDLSGDEPALETLLDLSDALESDLHRRLHCFAHKIQTNESAIREMNDKLLALVEARSEETTDNDSATVLESVPEEMAESALAESTAAAVAN